MADTLSNGAVPRRRERPPTREPRRSARLLPGPWVPGSELPAGAPEPVGFLVVDGLVTRDLLLAGGVASDLMGPGDLAGLDDADDSLLPTGTRWVVCTETQVTYLDPALLDSLGAHPELAARLLTRAARQSSRQAVQRAISQLSRVDARVMALMWHMAERWGRVGPRGVIVPIGLTHEALGRMVGARRPTVSLALKELAAEQALTRREDGAWVLDPRSADRFVLADDQPGPSPDPVLIAAAEAPSTREHLDASLLDRLQDVARRNAEQRELMRELVVRSVSARDDLRQTRLTRVRRRQA